MSRNKAFINTNLNIEARTLINLFLSNFQVEIDILKSKGEGWVEEHLFKYNERTLLGLLNNAIIRKCYEYSTFQEFSVYDKEETFVGRADLLISNEKFDFLIEAKKNTFDNKPYDIKAIDNLFEEPFKQIKKYFIKERQWYKEETYCCVLFFEYIPEQYFSAFEEYKEDKIKEDKIHFYNYYKLEETGLMIYGRVNKKKKKTKYYDKKEML